ncbi:uncharacterized protein BDR25DRAFT_350158 [Lindgomyces ingoldianus]|uniref:Uncharacterized protein n=1 Tax=Lindgomyces ingoldianus TaxID=673940 RepID=A0ACB6R9M7_9PLEO|nr:uncharacterized protein BDR25DRAFT_350158 [Lindgomyces ingoldianus]KAF2475891.1 hypothetical protein BDR25DRAFT_350158 [Lindgomyces ingoldianus]
MSACTSRRSLKYCIKDVQYSTRKAVPTLMEMLFRLWSGKYSEKSMQNSNSVKHESKDVELTAEYRKAERNTCTPRRSSLDPVPVRPGPGAWGDIRSNFNPHAATLMNFFVERNEFTEMLAKFSTIHYRSGIDFPVKFSTRQEYWQKRTLHRYEQSKLLAIQETCGEREAETLGYLYSNFRMKSAKPVQRAMQCQLAHCQPVGNMQSRHGNFV